MRSSDMIASFYAAGLTGELSKNLKKWPMRVGLRSSSKAATRGPERQENGNRGRFLKSRAGRRASKPLKGRGRHGARCLSENAGHVHHGRGFISASVRPMT